MNKFIKLSLGLVLSFGLALAAHAEADLVKKQESQRQTHNGYRVMYKAAAKDSPKVYAKAVKLFEKALKLDSGNEAAKAALGDAVAFGAGKGKPNLGALKGRIKASQKVVGAYKSMRKGDYIRADAYFKEAAKADPDYKGISAARRDLAEVKSSGIKEEGTDLDKYEEEPTEEEETGKSKK